MGRDLGPDGSEPIAPEKLVSRKGEPDKGLRHEDELKKGAKTENPVESSDEGNEDYDSSQRTQRRR